MNVVEFDNHSNFRLLKLSTMTIIFIIVINFSLNLFTSKNIHISNKENLPRSLIKSLTTSNSTKISEINNQVEISREAGQYYIIYEDVKHSIATSEFSYFNLSLTRVNKVIPDRDIVRITEGIPFNEFNETEKRNFLNLFLHSNTFLKYFS